MNNLIKKNYIFLLGFIILLMFYLRFEAFFPNNNGFLGHDYSLFLPYLMDGVYWFNANGLLEVPWFTPSFGGGLPKFPNPQAMYYSVPQFLSFIINPIDSLKLTIFIFGVLGFTGFYIFLAKIFKINNYVALLGSTLFLFNGFYLSRMIVGHLTFHSFMLFPILAFYIFRQLSSHKKLKIKQHFNDIIIGSVIFAYMIYSGAFHLIPVIFLGFLIVYFILKLTKENVYFYPFAIKVISIIVIGLLFSATKLNAGISFIGLFSRDFYKLSGYENFFSLIWVCFKSVFFIAPFESASKMIIGNIRIGPHEYEYGLTFIPFIIITLGSISFLSIKNNFKYFTKPKLKIIIIILLLLSIPLLLNYYTPAWNAFLKKIPLFKNSVTLIRWFSIYIPVLILFTVIAFEHIKWVQKFKIQTVIISIILIITISHFMVSKGYYHKKGYNPKFITENYKELKSKQFVPEIKSIGSKIEGKAISRNDLFIFGSSQLRPYEPIFGYSLEHLPQRTLVFGSVFKQPREGLLNIKNPVSYVFPKENKLSPGDHFKVTQLSEVDKFRTYHNYEFNISIRQKIANAISFYSLCLLAIYIIYKVIVLLGLKPYSRIRAK